MFCGAQPIFCDIDNKNFNLDPNKVESILKKEKVRAVLLVHLFGAPCDMDAFLYLKERYGFLLIEDCSQAHGATYNNKKVGSFGEAATFSCYATKNLPMGEGGICLFQSQEHYDLARKIMNHGRTQHYSHDVLGYNYRLSSLHAVLGIAALQELEENNKKRMDTALLFNEKLSAVVKTPPIPENITHVFHQYTIKTPRRNELQQWLTQQGIGNAIIYPQIIPFQPLYLKKFPSLKETSFPYAEKSCQEVISLPVHPYLNTKEKEKIYHTVLKFFV